MENIKLHSFEDSDIEYMNIWFKNERVRKWFQDPSDWMTEIEGRKTAYAWIHHFIVFIDKQPIGFCQYYDCYDARELELWYQVDKPNDTFSIDYFIGEDAYVSKGYGKLIVYELTKLIHTLGGRKIVVQPDEDNDASKYVLLANGYEYDEKKAYYKKYCN